MDKVGFGMKYGSSLPKELGNQFRTPVLLNALLQFKNEQNDYFVLKNSCEAGILAQDDCDVLWDEDNLCC